MQERQLERRRRFRRSSATAPLARWKQRGLCGREEVQQLHDARSGAPPQSAREGLVGSREWRHGYSGVGRSRGGAVSRVRLDDVWSEYAPRR